MNAIVLPAGYETGNHYHDEQEELYFVHRGRSRSSSATAACIGWAPAGWPVWTLRTVRRLRNVGRGRRSHLCAGGKDGTSAATVSMPEGEERTRQRPTARRRAVARRWLAAYDGSKGIPGSRGWARRAFSIA